MARSAHTKRPSACACGNPALPRIMATLRVVLAAVVLIFTTATLYNLGLFAQTDSSCGKLAGLGFLGGSYAEFDLKALSARIDDVLAKLETLQGRLESEIQRLDRNSTLREQGVPGSELRRILDEDVLQPLYAAHIELRLVRIPVADGGAVREDPLINFFKVEEIRKYITAKENRAGGLGVYGVNRTYATIGHACVRMREDLERYMSYEIGSYCDDDWHLAQRLILGGCDPLPRRRCLARAPRAYLRPLPLPESLWTTPDDRNVRWSRYRCRSYACLSGNGTARGFTKCSGCFDLEKERTRWVNGSSFRADFLIDDVLAMKQGEIRIGLDVSVGTGTFAARMWERNVTVVSTALNVGAPFSETIALRGLVPLYVSMNQRLPLFDNSMDLIHTGVFFDGWVDLQLLDFVLFDWDRVLRPGGLLWVDRFFCGRKDLDDYMYMFLQLRYRKHKWVVAPKSKDEVFLSAVLEKPPRSL